MDGQQATYKKERLVCQSSVLDVFIVFETGFSSEDLQLSHEGKWFILFLKILFRVEFFVLFCFLLF